MIKERKAEILLMTEAQALERLAGLGLRVEVEAFRGYVSATAYVIKSDPKSRKHRYDSEFFARVTELEYCHEEKWGVADGYSSIMRSLLVRVLDRMDEKRNRVFP